MQEVITKIAWINIRKSSKVVDGSNSSTKFDKNEIYSFGKTNKEIIVKQITSIKPDIIIACGEPVIYTIVDNELINSNLNKNLKFKFQESMNNPKVMFISHPSYFTDWGYEKVYQTFETIWETLQLTSK